MSDLSRRRCLTLLALCTAAAATGNVAAVSYAKPRLILCAVGPEDWLEIAAGHVASFGHDFTLDREYSLAEADVRIPNSFEASYDRVPPTFGDADRASVRAHASVVYALSRPLQPATSLQACARALELAARLLRDGALACKCDSAGVAHGRERWLTLADRAALASGDELAKILYRTWVRRPIADEETRYSCGLHLLGLPDVEYHGELDDLPATKVIDETAYALLRGESGFPRVPCTRYAEDEFFFNPYGYVRVADSA